MELLEALAKRRSCRDFGPEPVGAAVIDKLLYAAQRAPTASNVKYRELILVDDPRVIAAIKCIHPALLGSPPLLLIVVTNLDLAISRVGRVGNMSSLIDSGAAGENIVLVATDLKLGSQFTMISAMAGIRRLISLPAQYRVDLIIPIGKPFENKPAVRAPSASPPPVHHNQYGRPYAGKAGS
jgi:nitroreductase